MDCVKPTCSCCHRPGDDQMARSAMTAAGSACCGCTDRRCRNPPPKNHRRRGRTRRSPEPLKLPGCPPRLRAVYARWWQLETWLRELAYVSSCAPCWEPDGSKGAIADAFYHEAVVRLRRSHVALHLARAQLVYGEWLRRGNRRLDARQQLGPSRARSELLATDQTAPTRRGQPHAADTARSADRGTGARRAVESRDRCPVVHQSTHC